MEYAPEKKMLDMPLNTPNTIFVSLCSDLICKNIFIWLGIRVCGGGRISNH